MGRPPRIRQSEFKDENVFHHDDPTLVSPVEASHGKEKSNLLFQRSYDAFHSSYNPNERFNIDSLTTHAGHKDISTDYPEEVQNSIQSAPSGRIIWKRGQLLGSGSYGQVFLGLNIHTGRMMAVKQILLPPASKVINTAAHKKRLVKIEHEINLLRAMSYPTIVKYYGVQVDRTPSGDTTLDIFLEYVPGGSIASLLQNFGSFSEPLVRIYTRQILLGLQYLHRHDIVHRDIKGANILVDPSGVCKLADFGASTFIAELVAEENPSINGTVSWMAPEVIRQEGHDNKVDIWSVGCTVIEMISGKPPWSQFENMMAAMFHIAKTDAPPAIPDKLSDEGKDFVLRCLNRDPKKRPTATQLLQHPFVQDAEDAAEGTLELVPSGLRPSVDLGACDIPASRVPQVSTVSVFASDKKHTYAATARPIMQSPKQPVGHRIPAEIDDGLSPGDFDCNQSSISSTDICEANTPAAFESDLRRDDSTPDLVPRKSSTSPPNSSEWISNATQVHGMSPQDRNNHEPHRHLNPPDHTSSPEHVSPVSNLKYHNTRRGSNGSPLKNLMPLKNHPRIPPANSSNAITRTRYNSSLLFLFTFSFSALWAPVFADQILFIRFYSKYVSVHRCDLVERIAR